MDLESSRWLEPSKKARRISASERSEDSPTETEVYCSNVKSSPRSVESGSSRKPCGKTSYEFTSDDLENENKADLTTPDKVVQQTGSNKKRLLDSPSPTTPTAKIATTEEKRVRKFVCRYCNKAFSLMNVLKVHERIHTGEKPYICEICDKAFNQSGSLNRHKNTHMKRSCNNRSYSCRFCPRQFLHSSQLQEHESIEHGAVSKTISPHPHEQTSVEAFEGKTHSLSITDAIYSCSSPLRTHASPAGSSAQSSEDTAAASRLATPFNIFGKTEGSLLSFPPIPVGLNIFAPSGIKSTPITASGSFKMGTAMGFVSTAGTTNKSSESLQCDLCQQTFANRGDLDKHCGQHLLQQMGLSFGSTAIDPRVSAPLPTFGHSMNQALRLNTPTVPIEEILLNMLHNPIKLNLPQTPDPIAAISSTCAINSQQEDTLRSLTAALFPGAAAAATLSALSQLMLPNTPTSSTSSPANSNPPFNNTSTLTSTLTASSELHPDTTRFLGSQLPQPTLSNASMNSFTQLLKSITVTSSSPLPVTVDLYPSSHVVLPSARSCVDHEQGLNLAVCGKTETEIPNERSTLVNTKVPQPQSTKFSPCMPRPDVNTLPWLVNQDILVKSLSLAGLNNLPPKIVPTVNEVEKNSVSTPLISSSILTPRLSVKTTDDQAINEGSDATKVSSESCILRGDSSFIGGTTNGVDVSSHLGEKNASVETAKPSKRTTKDSCLYPESRENQWQDHPEDQHIIWKHCASTTVTTTDPCNIESGESDSVSLPRSASYAQMTTNGPNHALGFETVGNPSGQEPLGDTLSTNEDQTLLTKSRDVYNFSCENMKRDSIDRASQWSPMKLSKQMDSSRSQTTEDRSTESKSISPSVAYVDTSANRPDNISIEQNENGVLLSLLKHFQSQNVLWACKACKIYFLEKELWRIHEDQMHSTTGPFICAVCKEDQKDGRSLLAHFIQIHRSTSSNHVTSNRIGCSNKGATNRFNDSGHEDKTFSLCRYDENRENSMEASSPITNVPCGKHNPNTGWNGTGNHNCHTDSRNSNELASKEDGTSGLAYQKRIETDMVPRLCAISSNEDSPEILKEISGVITQT